MKAVSPMSQKLNMLVRANSSNPVTSQNRSSSISSNAGFKGDRFIPFRGTSDNFILEEFMLNNEDPYREQRRKRLLPSQTAVRAQHEIIITNDFNNTTAIVPHEGEPVARGNHSTPSGVLPSSH